MVKTKEVTYRHRMNSKSFLNEIKCLLLFALMECDT